MKNKILLSVVLGILLISLVSAADWPICIDTQNPSSPSNLQVTGNLALSWTASTDTPDCSGILYYKIYIDGNLVDSVSSTSYSTAALADGTYTIGVSAVDKANNEGKKATITATFPISSGGDNPSPPSTPSGGGGSGGGGGSSSSTKKLSTNETAENSGEQIDIKLQAGGEKEEESVESKGIFSMTGHSVSEFIQSKTGRGVLIASLIVLVGLLIFVKHRRNSKDTNPK